MTSRHDRARLIARALPTLALAAWVVTIWVPIMDCGTPGDDGVILTSLVSSVTASAPTSTDNDRLRHSGAPSPE